MYVLENVLNFSLKIMMMLIMFICEYFVLSLIYNIYSHGCTHSHTCLEHILRYKYENSLVFMYISYIYYIYFPHTCSTTVQQEQKFKKWRILLLIVHFNTIVIHFWTSGLQIWSVCNVVSNDFITIIQSTHKYEHSYDMNFERNCIKEPIFCHLIKITNIPGVQHKTN